MGIILERKQGFVYPFRSARRFAVLKRCSDLYPAPDGRGCGAGPDQVLRMLETSTMRKRLETTGWRFGICCHDWTQPRVSCRLQVTSCKTDGVFINPFGNRWLHGKSFRNSRRARCLREAE